VPVNDSDTRHPIPLFTYPEYHGSRAGIRHSKLCRTVSASSFVTPSLTALGAAFDEVLGFFQTKRVTSRTTLMTLIF